jgi:hypothetical protein
MFSYSVLFAIDVRDLGSWLMNAKETMLDI